MVVVTVVFFILLILDEPIVSGKSFISIIFLICDAVKAPGIFPVVCVVVVVVVCLKFLMSLEPKVAGKSFISTIFLTSEEVKALGIFLKSTFPVVLVVVVVVVCLKLLISFEPKVVGKSFISTIFLISEEVKALGIFLKSTFPVVLVVVVVVVVVCLKLLISLEPKVAGKSFILIIFCKFRLFLIRSSGLISCEVVLVKYLLRISSSVIFSNCGPACTKYLFISSFPVIGVTEATFPSSFIFFSGIF